jgi:hypothetical protein
MIKRAFIFAAFCWANAALCSAANLDALLFPLTGEVQLRNNSASAVPFEFYSISSASGALNPNAAVWKSVSDNYDLSGNGLIDPLVNWTKISATSNELTEGAFSGTSGGLPGFRSVTLGQIWISTFFPANDLVFSVLQADATPVTVTTQYALAGDYNADGTVNALDYVVWRANAGSTTSLAADGNLNGVVDVADYMVWRSNFGLSLPSGAGSSISGGASLSAAGVSVPEPATIVLMASVAIASLNARVRGRRAVRIGLNR